MADRITYGVGKPTLGPKDPDAVLDYVMDWSDWLGNDEIVSSTWSVSGGVTMDKDTHTTDTATVWLKGGATNMVASATNTIVTGAGRTDERTIKILVKER